MKDSIFDSLDSIVDKIDYESEFKKYYFDTEFCDFYEFIKYFGDMKIFTDAEVHNASAEYSETIYGILKDDEFKVSKVHFRYDSIILEHDDLYTSRYPKSTIFIVFHSIWTDTLISEKILLIFKFFRKFVGVNISIRDFIEIDIENYIEENFRDDIYWNINSRKIKNNTVLEFLYILHKIIKIFHDDNILEYITSILPEYSLRNLTVLHRKNVKKLIVDKIKLPKKIKTIEDDAFSFSNYKEIDLGNVERIENNAFESCYKLEYVKFSSNLKKIGKSAFSHCTSLKEVYIPPTVEEIGNFAFQNCFALEKVTIPEKFLSKKNLFTSCKKLKEIIKIPEEIKSIIFDKSKIQTIQTETNRLSEKLDEIFIEEQTIEQKPFESEKSLESNSKIKISKKNRNFLQKISIYESIERALANSFAKELGLMLDGVIETINNLSFDLFEDSLFEEDDLIYINQEYAKDILSKSESSESKKIEKQKSTPTDLAESPKKKVVIVVKKKSAKPKTEVWSPELDLPTSTLSEPIPKKKEIENVQAPIMEIIESAEFKRANIKFNKKPPKNVLDILKTAGWKYNGTLKIWIPYRYAAEGSLKFAREIEKMLK